MRNSNDKRLEYDHDKRAAYGTDHVLCLRGVARAHIILRRYLCLSKGLGEPRNSCCNPVHAVHKHTDPENPSLLTNMELSLLSVWAFHRVDIFSTVTAGGIQNPRQPRGVRTLRGHLAYVAPGSVTPVESTTAGRPPSSTKKTEPPSPSLMPYRLFGCY